VGWVRLLVAQLRFHQGPGKRKGLARHQIAQNMVKTVYSEVVVLGAHPDDLKFQSCMTLFAMAAPQYSIFQRALDEFFGGEPDPLTVALLA